MANTTKKAHTPFLLGLVTGFLLFWIAFDSPYVPVSFSSRPAPPSLGTLALPTSTPVIEHRGYTLAYDGRTKNPLWVYHRIESNSPGTRVPREGIPFVEEMQLPPHMRATPKDYQASGYDRGHLAPAADLSHSEESLKESFILSNVAPQIAEFNRGYWKRLENWIRSEAAQFSALHVFTGPLYLPSKERGGGKAVKYKVIGLNEVAVPTHFFALLLGEIKGKSLVARAFILPNKPISSETPLDPFSVSIQELERASGILFTQLTQRAPSGFK